MIAKYFLNAATQQTAEDVGVAETAGGAAGGTSAMETA